MKSGSWIQCAESLGRSLLYPEDPDFGDAPERVVHQQQEILNKLAALPSVPR